MSKSAKQSKSNLQKQDQEESRQQNVDGPEEAEKEALKGRRQSARIKKDNVGQLGKKESKGPKTTPVIVRRSLRKK